MTLPHVAMTVSDVLISVMVAMAVVGGGTNDSSD